MEKIKIIKTLEFYIIVEFNEKQFVVFPNCFCELKSNKITLRYSELWPIADYGGFYNPEEKHFYRIVGIFILDEDKLEDKVDLAIKTWYYGGEYGDALFVLEKY